MLVPPDSLVLRLHFCNQHFYAPDTLLSEYLFRIYRSVIFLNVVVSVSRVQQGNRKWWHPRSPDYFRRAQDVTDKK